MISENISIKIYRDFDRCYNQEELNKVCDFIGTNGLSQIVVKQTDNGEEITYIS